MFIATDILQLMPTFQSGAHQLHNILIGVTFVMSFCGLVLLCNRALQERSVTSIFPTLIRLTLIVILVGSLGGLVDMVSSGVTDITSQLGLSGVNGGIFSAYRDAVARKFGSDSAAKQGQQAASQAPSNQTGVTLNHFGYEKPGDPNYDSNSARGIGAFNFDDKEGSLVQLQSAALSSDVVQKYNLQPGQEFTVTTANGPMTLIYADKTADWVQGSIDVYDPNQVLQSNQLTSVQTLVGGEISPTAQQGPLGGWISKIGDSLTIGLLWPLVHLLSLIAMGCMWLMTGVQQILYTIEIAVSPIFLGMVMIPALRVTATRFFMSLAAITVWPLAWAICDLLTKALIDIAVNPTNNLGQSGFSAGSMLMGYWVLLAIWVIGSSFAAPLLVSFSLIGGAGSGIAAMFGATVGAVAMRSAGGTAQAATLASGAISAPMVAASTAARTAFTNYARRGK